MSDTRPSGRDTEVLSVEGISVTLGGREILKDVSFGVRGGQFAGMIGSNGAGKTTLLRTIIGLQRPSAGRIELLGAERTRHDRAIGYVPQKVVFDPDIPLRTRDLVALGLDGHRFGIPLRWKRRAEAVDEMLHAVGADHFAGSRVGLLSGGEQQRALIAHALIGRPPLLLLDEPLANLDLHSTQEIVELLGRIAKEQNVAVLLTAHEMNPLLPVMDQIVYLADGRAASGSVDEVIRPDVLTRLYGHHVDVIHVHDRVLVIAGHGTGDDAAPPVDLTIDSD